MKTRQETLLEVYEYLHEYCNLHTKRDFAKKLRMTAPAMSAAMNGNESYLTRNLFMKICAAYPGKFNLDYLLTGIGELLAQPNNLQSDTGMASEPQPATMPMWADNLLSIMSKQIAENERLHNQLQQSIKEIDELKSQLAELIKIKRT